MDNHNKLEPIEISLVDKELKQGERIYVIRRDAIIRYNFHINSEHNFSINIHYVDGNYDSFTVFPEDFENILRKLRQPSLNNIQLIECRDKKTKIWHVKILDELITYTKQ